MATTKPTIVQLLTDLQKAVDTAEKLQVESQKAAASYQLRHDAAQKAYDAEVGAARKVLTDASDKFVEASGKVEALQAEVNSVLGTFTKSRVTISK